MLDVLRRLEKNPTAAFSRGECEGFRDKLVPEGLFRRMPQEESLIRDGRVVTLIAEDDGYFTALDQDDPDYAERLTPDDLDLFEIDIARLIDAIRDASGLLGPHGRLTDRLLLLGERDEVEAVFLALLPNGGAVLPTVASLPTLTSSKYGTFYVVFPSLAPQPSEARVLESMGILTLTMDSANPLRIDLGRVHTPQERQSASVPNFSHSDGYSSVTLNGRHFSLAGSEARVVELLDRARLRGSPEVSWQSLVAQIPTSPRGMSDVFRRVPAWKELIAQPRQGVYRLNM